MIGPIPILIVSNYKNILTKAFFFFDYFIPTLRIFTMVTYFEIVCKMTN
jgi:uncharacterized membrane protein